MRTASLTGHAVISGDPWVVRNYDILFLVHQIDLGQVSYCGHAFHRRDVHETPKPVTCLWCVAGMIRR